MDTGSTAQAKLPQGDGAWRACRVFVVEDAPAIRCRLVQLIEAAGNARVVGEASTPTEATQGILEARPDCTILDFHLRGGTGLDVLRGIRAGGDKAVVVMLSNETDPAYREACLAAGARWFLNKSAELEKVREIVTGLAPRSASDRREPCPQ